MEPVLQNQSLGPKKRSKSSWIWILVIIALVLVYLLWQGSGRQPLGPDGLTDGERQRIIAETSSDPTVGDGLTDGERQRIIAETSALPSN